MRRAARRPIGPATPQPLAIIAGLPSPNHQAVASEIAGLNPTWKVISEPFPKAPRSAYADRGAIYNLLRAVAGFAEDHGQHRPPRPGLLALFYVADAGDQGLLDAFGLSTHAVRLDVPDWEWPKGRHWRSDPDIVVPLVQARLAEFSAGGRRNELKLRLERQGSGDPLLLPPRNFRMPDGSLFPRFEQAHALGSLPELDVSDVKIENFDAEDLPAFFAKTGEVRKDFCVDDRGLVFATSVRGQHGPSRVVGSGEIEALSGFRPVLEGCYRFGTPLREGFQHDAQWRKDKLLKEEVFLDVDREIPISATHANVYANDRVR